MSIPYEAEIMKYLAENLPASEERIPVPINPDCEVCMIIPAYNERDYILVPLESLTRQNSVTPDQFEVIVVVNNPAGPPPKGPGQSDESYDKKCQRYQQAVRNNWETLKLIEYINREDEDENVDIQLRPGEREIIGRIRSYGLKVFAVDKTSQGKTLPASDANVGGARNRGAAEAVERFYKQLRRNGILAHTDADTRLDENYMCNLINVFKENPAVVGVGGVDEDILEDPRQSEMMIELIKGFMAGVYGMLVHLGFLADKSEPAVFFIGSAMATRAFETAVIGGIPKLAGGEDYALGRKIEEIGQTKRALNVVTFPVIRPSLRTTTGKGLLMTTYGVNEEDGITRVRSLEAVYYLAKVYKRLQQARENQQTSIGNLRKILVIDNEPILNEADLSCLSQHIHQFHSYRRELVRPELRDIMAKICDKIDEKFEPIPIDKAVDELIILFCANKNLEIRFQQVRAKMIEERTTDIAVLEKVLAEIFKRKQQNRNGDKLIPAEWVIPLLESSQTTLLKKKYRLNRVSRLIALADTKEEALELIKVNYLKELLLPGHDPGISPYFDLLVLQRSLGRRAV